MSLLQKKLISWNWEIALEILFMQGIIKLHLLLWDVMSTVIHFKKICSVTVIWYPYFSKWPTLKLLLVFFYHWSAHVCSYKVYTLEEYCPKNSDPFNLGTFFPSSVLGYHLRKKKLMRILTQKVLTQTLQF